MDVLEKWLTIIIKGLVSQPDEVKILASEDEQGVLFVIEVAKEDTGKVIGKKGTIAEAIRVILRSAGYIQEVRASMKVNAPGSTFDLKETKE